MKALIRLTSLFLIAIMIFSLASCQTVPTNTDDTTQADVTTLAPDNAKESFELVSDGSCKVRIVRPMDLPTDDPAVLAAIEIRTALTEATGAKNVDIGDDWIKPGESHNADTVEILVGHTSYDETKTAASSLAYGDYVVKAIGNKIVVLGYSDSSLAAAAQALCDTIRANVKNGNSLTLKVEQIDMRATENPALSAVSVYDGAEYSSYYDPGDSCHELIFKKATPENYREYIAKLETEGFTKYTSNDMNGNLFTTLYNDKYTLNVGFYKPDLEARVIVEPFSDSTLIGLEADNKYEKVTTTQITMFGCEYKKGVDANGAPEYASNGLSLLIRLSDGRFVIVDGGFNNYDCTYQLCSAMKEQSRDYVSSINDITIAAWIITHSHGDHYGALIGKTDAFKQFKCERLIVNFMSDEVRQNAMVSRPQYWGEGNDGGGWPLVIEAGKSLGAEIVIAHVGQRFYFADTVFEVLYTVESFAPAVVNALNTTSLVIMATTTDPASGRTTKTMITGDATGPVFGICNKMYGDYMKCDIVQVAHHGGSTASVPNNTARAYSFMKPSTVLWPIGGNAFPSYMEKEQNLTLYGERNPNWKETHVAGWNGSYVTVPLPYTYGVDTVTVHTTKET